MRNFTRAILAIAAIAGSSSAANAFDGAVPANFITPVQAHFMPSGEGASIPAGYVSFCIRFVDQCQISANDSIALDNAAWKAINQINASVNDAIWPEEDQKHYGRAEYWNIPTDGLGDCEDYALTKRKELAAAGYPMSALRIAIVVTREGERHAVLTIATDKGDLVLDNLNDDVQAWNATGYRWIARQDPHRAMQWVAVADRPVLIAQGAGDAPTGQLSQ